MFRSDLVPNQVRQRLCDIDSVEHGLSSPTICTPLHEIGCPALPPSRTTAPPMTPRSVSHRLIFCICPLVLFLGTADQNLASLLLSPYDETSHPRLVTPRNAQQCRVSACNCRHHLFVSRTSATVSPATPRHRAKDEDPTPSECFPPQNAVMTVPGSCIAASRQPLQQHVPAAQRKVIVPDLHPNKEEVPLTNFL